MTIHPRTRYQHPAVRIARPASRQAGKSLLFTFDKERSEESRMKPLTRSAAVIALLVLPASSTFAASNDRHRARSHDGAYAGAYGYEGGTSRPLYAGGAWSTGPIYRHGYYLGTDPDPRVRAEIVRDKFSGR
jgi:hypothetical protein